MVRGVVFREKEVQYSLLRDRGEKLIILFPLWKRRKLNMKILMKTDCLYMGDQDHPFLFLASSK